MTLGVPWHVKGVRPEARDSARHAAHQAGLSVGEWLNEVILESAQDDPNAPPPRRARSESDETARRLAEAIVQLDRRIEQLAQEGRSQSKALERRVESVDRALSSLGQPGLGAASGSWASPMDQAMAEIQMRQRELDGAGLPFRYQAPPPRPRAPARQERDYGVDFSDVQEKLKRITDQIDSLGASRMHEAIASLRNDLAEIARSLTEASPRRAIEALEGEIRRLASRLDMKSREEGGANFAALERGLNEVRDALRVLTPAENLSGAVDAIQVLSRKIDQVAANASDPASLQPLESAIEGLRGLVSRVASSDALAALTEEVRTLAARLDREPPAVERDNDILRTLEQRISTIADAIEAVRASGSRTSSPDIDAMVRTLGDKIERLHAQSDNSGLAKIEQRIDALVNRLDASESRLGNLDAIERGMKDLLDHLTEMRRDREAVTRPVEAIQQSLEAAHDTIGNVVDRLAMIETGIRQAEAKPRSAPPPPPSPPPSPSPTVQAPSPAAAAYQTVPVVPSPPLQAAAPHIHPVPGSAPAAPPPAAPAAQAAPAARAAPQRAAAAARTAEAQRQAQAARPAVAQARPTADGTLPYDFPLEPGSGKPRPGMAQPAPAPTAAGMRTVSTPAARIAESRAALEPGRAAASGEAESKSNFIAAARRAAQYAVETQGEAPAAGTGRAAAEGGPSWRARLGRYVKPALLTASVLVLLAAAIHLALGYLFAPASAPVAPAPKPQSQSQIAPPARSAPIVPAAEPADDDAEDPAEGGSGVIGPTTPTLGAPMAPHPAAPPPPPAPPALPRASAQPAPETTGSVTVRNVMPSAQPAPAAPQDLAPPPVAVAAPVVAPGPRRLTPPPASLFAMSVPPRVAPLPPAIGSRMLVQAAESGDPGAAYEIAMRYSEGRGVAVDTEQTAAWMERAARAGLTPALFRLGGIYEKGIGVRKDLNRARGLYLEAAERGNAKAMHNLAVLYADGIDGKPDYAAAVDWFTKAAMRGVTDSQFNLGVLYARGVGMEQNLSESYKWFALAAQSGDRDAGQKRDDVAKRLDQATLGSIKASLKTWTPVAQPEDAFVVKAPPGGWDQGPPASAAAAPVARPKAKAKPKRAATTATYRVL